MSDTQQQTTSAAAQTSPGQVASPSSSACSARHKFQPLPTVACAEAPSIEEIRATGYEREEEYFRQTSAQQGNNLKGEDILLAPADLQKMPPLNTNPPVLIKQDQPKTGLAANELFYWTDGKRMNQSKLAEYIMHFQMGAGKSQIHSSIPTSFIDPDIFRDSVFTAKTPDDVPTSVLSQAKKYLDFSEGFPTYQGLPFWERFDGEPLPYYEAFKTYLRLRENTGTRSLTAAASVLNIKAQELTVLSRIFHWLARATAYDLYQDMLEQIAVQKRQNKMKKRHQENAEALIETAMRYLEENEHLLNPKVALEMVNIGMKQERLANDLLPDKPGSRVETGDSYSSNSKPAGQVINIQATAGVASNDSSGYQVVGAQIGSSTEPVSSTHAQLLADMKQPNNISSVLQVLQASGALDLAALELVKAEDDADIAEVEDADYEELEEA